MLRELLDVVLGDRVNPDGATFQERFHLLVDPPQVRFRFLVIARVPLDERGRNCVLG